MRNFRKLPRKPIVEGDCDVVVNKPTYILKIDAGIVISSRIKCIKYNIYFTAILIVL